MRRDARILDARTRRACLHHRQFNGRERIDATDLIQNPVRGAPIVRLEETGILGGDHAYFGAVVRTKPVVTVQPSRVATAHRGV